MTDRSLSLLLPALLLALWVPEAHAEPKDDARRHFVAGLAAAQAQQYQAALDEFLAAQAAYPHPNTLYNIGRSYADLGDLEKALEYYRLFRAAAPDKADFIDPTIAVLQAQLDAQRAPPPAANPPSVAEGGPVNAEDVARLQAITAELQALAASLAERKAPVVAEAPTPEATPTPPTPAAVPDQGALLSDAYERVVVTASRYGQSPLESPSTVTILTSEDIRMSGATNIPDVLRRVAGIDVMFLSAGQGDISIRGFNRELSNKVLVLVDGRSIYLDALGTTGFPMLELSLEEIDRIEVIRGPGSAIYGANAMTGVVNIITRVPGEGESLVHVEGGGPSYLRGTALVDGRKDQTAWRMSAGWDQTGRWSVLEPIEGETPVLEPFLDDQQHAWRGVHADGRIDRAFLDKGLASLSAGYSHGNAEFYALGALGDYAMEYTAGFARGDLAYGPVHLRAFYNGLLGPTAPWASYVGGRSLDSTLDSDTADVELEGNGELTTGPVGHRFNAGIGYRYKRVDWEYISNGDTLDEHHFSAFLQEQAKVGPVAIVASLRADKTPLLPLSQTISPRGAAIVRVADHTSVRLTGGTSYRSPTMLESYTDLAQPSTRDGIYVHTTGDATLLPERILTGEIGLHDESTSFHVADVAGYVNRVTNLIGLTDVERGFSYYDPVNNGYNAGETGFVNLSPTYLAFGGEAEGRVFPADGLDIFANVSVERILQQDGEVTTPDESTSALKVNGGAVYRSPWRLDVAAQVNFVSAQTWTLREYDDVGQLVDRQVEVPARTIVTARLAGRPFADDKLELAVAGWNIGALAGATFREHPNGQLVGARYWGEATWRF